MSMSDTRITSTMASYVHPDAERYMRMSRAECRALGIVRVILYLRISRDDAEIKGLGVDRQAEDCVAALPRISRVNDEQWVIVAVLDENNTSASRGKERPHLVDGLSRIRQGNADALMFYTQERFTRWPIEVEYILIENETAPIRLATSIKGELDLTDPDVVHSMRTTVANDAREVAVIKRRRMRETNQYAERGRRHGAAPFGWLRESRFTDAGRRLDSIDKINEPEAAVLRYAAKQILAGVSLRSLTLELAAGDVHPRVRQFEKTGPSSGKWTSKQLKSYLLRESNVCIRVHRGEPTDVPGDWPAIFTTADGRPDTATYQRLRMILNDPARKTTERGRTPKYMLTSIARCGRCEDGGHILAQLDHRTRTPVYVCTGTQAKRGCYQRHRVADIDSFIDDAVEKILADESAAEPADDADAELAPLYARLDALMIEQAEWDNAPVKPHQLIAQTARIDAERDAIDAEISALMPTLNGSIDLPNGWSGADIPTRKAMVRNLFESITLNLAVEKHKGRKFQPADITVIPRKRKSTGR